MFITTFLITTKESNKIVIDFLGVQGITLYNAKQILGELYLKLGSGDFFKRIQLKNISSNLEYIIRLEIQDSIHSREEEYV